MSLTTILTLMLAASGAGGVLQKANAGGYLARIVALFKSILSGTNAMDLAIVVKGE